MRLPLSGVGAGAELDNKRKPIETFLIFFRHLAPKGWKKRNDKAGGWVDDLVVVVLVESLYSQTCILKLSARYQRQLKSQVETECGNIFTFYIIMLNHHHKAWLDQKVQTIFNKAKTSVSFDVQNKGILILYLISKIWIKYQESNLIHFT